LEAAERIPLLGLPDNPKKTFLSSSGGGEEEGEGVTPQDLIFLET